MHITSNLSQRLDQVRDGYLTARYVLHFEQGAGTRGSLKSRKTGQGPRWRSFIRGYSAQFSHILSLCTVDVITLVLV